MPTTGRTQISTYGNVGGSRRVFYTPAEHTAVSIVNGVKLDPNCSPIVGDKVFAGDFGFYDYSTGLASHLNTFKLAKALTISDTEVYFEGDELSHNPNGVIVMKAPTTDTGTGAAALISAVLATYDGKPVYKATIVAGSLGTGSVGDIFVQADSAGTGKTVKVPKVNMIFGSDIDVKFPLATAPYQWNVANATINGYFHHTVYVDAINLPPYVASLNKMSNVEHLFEL